LWGKSPRISVQPGLGKELRSVQVSSDGGKNWQEATFIDKGIPYCWRRWEWMWTPKVKGEAVLMAKATDATGTGSTADPRRGATQLYDQFRPANAGHNHVSYRETPMSTYRDLQPHLSDAL
jgi:hypothetical protein